MLAFRSLAPFGEIFLNTKNSFPIEGRSRASLLLDLRKFATSFINSSPADYDGD